VRATAVEHETEEKIPARGAVSQLKDGVATVAALGAVVPAVAAAGATVAAACLGALFFAGEEDFRAAIFDPSCDLWFEGNGKGESYKDRCEKSNENMVSELSLIHI